MNLEPRKTLYLQCLFNTHITIRKGFYYSGFLRVNGDKFAESAAGREIRLRGFFYMS